MTTATSWISVVILLLATAHDVYVYSADVPNVCRGTNYGVLTSLHGSTPSDRLTRLQTRYSGCQLVSGNVEIVGISNGADFDFLKDIREITGYLLVYQIQGVTVSLPNLVLVRGRTLFKDSSTGNAVGLAVLDNPQLQELDVPNLREISSGVAMFRGNPNICHIDSIRWDDILMSPLAGSVGLNSTAAGCAACNLSCSGRCWGRSSQSCQAPLSRVACPSCLSRCYVDGQCCHGECSAGCLSPGISSACQICQNFVNLNHFSLQGDCRPSDCPSDTVLWPQFSLCSTSCKAPFLLDSEAKLCSESCSCRRVGPVCSFLQYDDVTRQCEVVTPGVAVCPGVERIGPILHKGNIDNFANCQVVQGSIQIDALSFTGNASAGIQPLTVHDLSKLFNITEIDGYLAVTDIADLTFANLSFLSNLRAIRGRYTPYGGKYSIYIVGNLHLRALQTTSLERVDRGDIKIADNRELSYVDTVNWTEIALAPLTAGASGIEVTNNQNRSISVQLGEVCDVECDGCWFTGPMDCVKCQNHEFQGICVAECNLHLDGTCAPCPDVCTRFCNGPTGFNCTSDGPAGSECKYLLEGLECVETCSVGTYEDVPNKKCLPCPSVCHVDRNPTAGSPLGCSGVSLSQGPGGCDRCEKIENITSGKCIHVSDTCPNGTYLGTRPFGSGSVPACLECTPDCSLCTGPGTMTSNCQLCTNRLQGDLCVDSCSVSSHYEGPDGYTCRPCHPQCSSCSGPLDTDCTGCKNSMIKLVIPVTDSPTTGRTTSHAPTTWTSTPMPVTSPSPSNLTGTNLTSCFGVNCSTTHPTVVPTTQAPATPKTITLTQCIAKCPNTQILVDLDKFCVSKCSPGSFNDSGVCSDCSPLCDLSLGCKDSQPTSCDRCNKFTLLQLDGTTECLSDCPDVVDVKLVNETICLEFHATAAPTNDTSTPEPPVELKSTIIGQAVGSAVGGLIFIALMIIGVYFGYQRFSQPAAGIMVHMVELGKGMESLELLAAEDKLEIITADALEIGDKLGTGCYGIVHRGYWCPESHKVRIPVAIKMLSESLSTKQEKELMQEAVKMAAANDPNVLRLIGVCFSGQVQLVAQYCPFGPLLAFLRRQKHNLTPMALMTYSLQIAKAMDYLEKKALVHGNLACRNVLVLKPNQVRVTDFALSSLVDSTAEGLPLAWLSPESIELNVFTHQSDVWSFGVTLWEIMTFGGVPYRTKVGQDLLAILQAGERLQQPKTVTIEVYAVMLQCWIIEDSSRPCFEDVAKELDTLRKDPARYVLTAYADEAVTDNRSSTLRSMYSDTLAADGDYEFEFDPNVQNALYEDPDAYEGFLHYEDPDKLQMPGKTKDRDADDSQDRVSDYENPNATLKRAESSEMQDDYENPNTTLKRAESSEMQDDYERADGTIKVQQGYETLRTQEREKSTEYENPGHSYGHPAVAAVSSTASGYSYASNSAGQNETSIFDEPGYEPVGPGSESPSRIGSKREQGQFESDTMLLREPSPGYEDPSAVLSATKPSGENETVIQNGGAMQYEMGQAVEERRITQPQAVSGFDSMEMDDMGTSDHYQDPGDVLREVR